MESSASGRTTRTPKTVEWTILGGLRVHRKLSSRPFWGGLRVHRKRSSRPFWGGLRVHRKRSSGPFWGGRAATRTQKPVRWTFGRNTCMSTRDRPFPAIISAELIRFFDRPGVNTPAETIRLVDLEPLTCLRHMGSDGVRGYMTNGEPAYVRSGNRTWWRYPAGTAKLSRAVRCRRRTRAG